MIQKKVTKKTECYCQGKKKNCKVCNGKNQFREYIYYHIDEKKKIAISGDTLK